MIPRTMKPTLTLLTALLLAPLVAPAADSSSKTIALSRTGVSFHTSDAKLQQLLTLPRPG